MIVIRTLLALTSVYKLIIPTDVKTALLNVELDEEIYMEQPGSFIVKGQEKEVCKLVKSPYGLKQAPKQCRERFDRVTLSYGFIVNEFVKCVCSKVIG